MQKPIKHWVKYDSYTRANLSASHRLYPGQREAIGYFFWSHPALPGIAFPTRKAANLAAEAAIAKATSSHS